jgi:DUF1009 family protein
MNMTIASALPSPPMAGAKIGLLAGWGRYPLVVARALANQGYQTYCLGVKGHADPALAELCTDFAWIGLARLGQAADWYRSHGVRDLTMAGKIHKQVLFEPWAWLTLLPDFRTLRRFYRHFFTTTRDNKDDTLLLAVVAEFASAGLTFGPATDYAPDLLVKVAQLTTRGPSPKTQKDIEFGWRLAKELGRLDVGQSVCVRRQAAVAVEAMEGTDACIARAGQLCRGGKFTVVKVAKPKQDLRFDMPTVGVRTLETMVAAGADCLAIEGGRTILLDEEEVLRFANQKRITIVGLSADGQLPPLSETSSADDMRSEP